MKKSAAFFVLLSLLGLRCTETLASVQVYVAYADTQNVNCPNLNPPPFMPDPWQGSPKTAFLGYSGPAWNTGAILIFNPGRSTVTLQSAIVTIGAKSYSLWTGLIGPGVPITSGSQLILAQTTTISNFKATGTAPAAIPQIKLTISGVASTYADSGQILTTGGTSLGNQTPPINESLQWRLAGTSGVSLPGGTGVNPPAVLTWHNDNARTGQNSSETSLRPSNVNAAFFGQIGAYYGLDAPVVTQPLFLPNLVINGASHNAVIVETINNSIYAFDAEVSGTYPAVPPLLYLQGSNTSAGTAVGTPVIDPSTDTLYFVSAAIPSSSTKPVFSLHALNLTTGKEETNSPQIINGSVIGSGEEQCLSQPAGVLNSVCFDAGNQSQRAALLLNNGTVYVVFADGGDKPPYHGWVFGYDTSNLASPPFVFNTTPNATTSSASGLPGQTSSNEQSSGGLPTPCTNGQMVAGGGIWMWGAGPAADANGIFFTSGNGDFNASVAEYGDSILRLAPTNQRPIDYFTPYDQRYLNCFDYDFGSSGPLLLQDSAKGYLVQATKPGRVYLINEANMGQYNPNCTTSTALCDKVVQALDGAIGAPALQPNVYGSPAYFNSTVIYKANNDYLKAFKVLTPPMTIQPLLQTPPIQATAPAPPTANSATPSISYDATTAGTGIVWLVEPVPGQANSQLEAYDATTLRQLYSLWTGVSIGQSMFLVPTVADGKVFVGGGQPSTNQGILVVFGNKAIPTPPGTLTVTKTIVPSNDSGQFDLLVNGVTRASSVGNGGTTPTLELAPGQYAVSEHADPGTTGAYARVFGGACDAAGNVCVTPASNATCTISNTRDLCPTGERWCPNTYGNYACRPSQSCAMLPPQPCRPPNKTMSCGCLSPLAQCP